MGTVHPLQNEFLKGTEGGSKDLFTDIQNKRFLKRFHFYALSSFFKAETKKIIIIDICFRFFHSNFFICCIVCIYIFIYMHFSVLSNQSINFPSSKEDVEKCKQRDLLEQLLKEMTGEFPALSRVFVDERDIYLTHSLKTAAQPRDTLDMPEGVLLFRLTFVNRRKESCWGRGNVFIFVIYQEIN